MTDAPDLTAAPTDADFDDMHHALGRPDGPHVEPYRNYYCCGAGGDQARRFEALGLWSMGRSINGGADAVYFVTAEGRRQVMAWLAERHRKAGLRLFVVQGGGLTSRTILAKSAGAAKYDVYLDVSDCRHFDDGFRGFLRLGVTARAA